MAKKKAKKKTARAGRTASGKIKKGYYLSCTGTMKKAKSKKKRSKKKARRK